MLISVPFRLLPFIPLLGHIWRSCAVQQWFAPIAAHFILDVLFALGPGLLLDLYRIIWSEPVRFLARLLLSIDLPPWFMDFVSLAVIFGLTLWRLLRLREVQRRAAQAHDNDSFLNDVTAFIERTQQDEGAAGALLARLQEIGRIDPAPPIPAVAPDVGSAVPQQGPAKADARALADEVFHKAARMTPDALSAARLMLESVYQGAKHNLNDMYAYGLEMDPKVHAVETRRRQTWLTRSDLRWAIYASSFAALGILATIKVEACQAPYFTIAVIGDLWSRLFGV